MISTLQGSTPAPDRLPRVNGWGTDKQPPARPPALVQVFGIANDRAASQGKDSGLFLLRELRQLTERALVQTRYSVHTIAQTSVPAVLLVVCVASSQKTTYSTILYTSLESDLTTSTFYTTDIL